MKGYIFALNSYFLLKEILEEGLSAHRKWRIFKLLEDYDKRE